MEMHIRPVCAGDEEALVALWHRCGLVRPQNDPQADIRRKRTIQPDLFLVGELNGSIVASVMAGYEGHRGWLNYLAVDPHLRRQGLGRAIVSDAERRLLALGCPKVNLQIRTSNHEVVEFYRRIGYSVDEVISMGKRLMVDAPKS
jgi:ribosomal protein S18 acetylase RimI-like enzyme